MRCGGGVGVVRRRWEAVRKRCGSGAEVAGKRCGGGAEAVRKRRGGGDAVLKRCGGEAVRKWWCGRGADAVRTEAVRKRWGSGGEAVRRRGRGAEAVRKRRGSGAEAWQLVRVPRPDRRAEAALWSVGKELILTPFFSVMASRASRAPELTEKNRPA
jgi:hypothetical protein